MERKNQILSNLSNIEVNPTCYTNNPKIESQINLFCIIHQPQIEFSDLDKQYILLFSEKYQFFYTIVNQFQIIKEIQAQLKISSTTNQDEITKSIICPQNHSQEIIGQAPADKITADNLLAEINRLRKLVNQLQIENEAKDKEIEKLQKCIQITYQRLKKK